MMVNMGMWFERFTIIAVGLTRDFLPSSWGTYHPSFIEVFTFVGTFGVWLLADHIGLSPIITMVVYGMTLARDGSPLFCRRERDGLLEEVIRRKGRRLVNLRRGRAAPSRARATSRMSRSLRFGWIGSRGDLQVFRCLLVAFQL